MSNFFKIDGVSYGCGAPTDEELEAFTGEDADPESDTPEASKTSFDLVPKMKSREGKDSMSERSPDLVADPEAWRYYSDVVDKDTISWLQRYVKMHPEDKSMRRKLQRFTTSRPA